MGKIGDFYKDFWPWFTSGNDLAEHTWELYAGKSGPPSHHSFAGVNVAGNVYCGIGFQRGRVKVGIYAENYESPQWQGLLAWLAETDPQLDGVLSKLSQQIEHASGKTAEPGVYAIRPSPQDQPQSLLYGEDHDLNGKEYGTNPKTKMAGISFQKAGKAGRICIWNRKKFDLSSRRDVLELAVWARHTWLVFYALLMEYRQK